MARNRRFPDQSFEYLLGTLGFREICGVDEAGRGPLAGPVVAAAVILPQSKTISGVSDSKALTPRRREELADTIKSECVDFSIGVVSAEEIDRLNILNASLEAMRKAVAGLGRAEPDILLIDGNRRVPIPTPQVVLKRGDARCYSIAAASIIAKCARDKIMREYNDRYPTYGFDRHKGYGTAFHREMLERHGPCPIHRRTFSPVREKLADSWAQTSK
ncbi:MAG: ribonuclease HII [bacterium]